MRMQVILDSSFARPGSVPIWGGKKGEFRDWTKAKENGKTGLRPLRLVGNFLSMPQSPVFTRSISAEGRTEACGLVLRFHGFTAYQCVRADVGLLNQHPSNNHSFRVTPPASLFVN